jgi:hypothetical protein
MKALARRWLMGLDAEADLERGAAMMARAAASGDAEATSALATLVAAGCGRAQSWSAAFDLLRLGAERGCEDARGQLVLLARTRGGSAGPGPRGEDPSTWARLRAAIDFDAWTTPPPKRSLCDAPRVRAADGLCPPGLCDRLARRAAGGLRTAMMYDGAARRARWSADRTCSEYAFDLLSADVAILLLRARIAALVSLPTSFMEPPQVFHYAAGQEIKPHYDYVYVGSEGHGQKGAYTSERVVSVLIYLNDDFQGGELEFPLVGLRHRGKKGDAVFFANVDAAGKPDRLSLHAGRPVSGGEKWLLSQWIHDQPFQARV